MLINWGLDYFELRNGRRTPVSLATARAINGHVLIVGASGVGKSWTIRSMTTQAAKSNPNIRIHVMDVHGDLNIPGASMVKFSEASEAGINPFIVNPDVEYGGVRRCINTFIRVVEQATGSLGVQQVNIIRDLLTDVYHNFGFDIKDSSTWSLNAYESRLISGGADNRLYLEVPLPEKDEAKALGARWDGDKRLWWIHTHKYEGGLKKWRPAYKARTYPTLTDLIEYTESVYRQRFLGSDQKGIKALETVNKLAQALQKKMLQQARDETYSGTTAEMTEEFEQAKEKLKDAFNTYVDNIRTGKELDGLLKYRSPDTLQSALVRMKNLDATGVFKPHEPNFDRNAPIWRYHMKALLSAEEKKMLVLFKLQEIFNRAVQRGEQDDVVEVIVLDELGTYTSSADKDGGDGIIGVIAREARKFGLALWAATQTLSNIPEDLMTSVATKVVLGIDEKFWPGAVTSLNIEKKLLSWIQPQVTIGVQMKEKRALKNRWWWVQLEEQKTG